MRILFLDDDADRHRRFKMANIGRDITYCFTYEACLLALAGPRFDVAQLDHDLSERQSAGFPCPDEMNGKDVARFIAGMAPDKRPAQIVIHSFNDKEARKMGRILVDAGCEGVMISKFSFPPG